MVLNKDKITNIWRKKKLLSLATCFDEKVDNSVVCFAFDEGLNFYFEKLHFISYS
ncbi:hypothetical protein [Clostridium sp. ZS2-4]|uniref:hypothetical protein n=1 Tax=Clostridium sp. ZS2-4 TaxID=2987703 RepID=UPI00227B6857|nr:hypothetical protein [Clostridium sp. ZS2-4]MCY6356867.1 hypothetical protein [Clostridium sp. ZS2-4]